MLLSITEFIAHFHPLIVHLPIGILLIGLALLWLSEKNKYASFRQAVPFVLLCGAITALISCITGFLLSVSDDYDDTLVGWHQWMGIAVAFTSWVLFAKEKNPRVPINKKLLSIGLLLLIMITGHLGGSLTHGSDYLTKPLFSAFDDDSTSGAVIKPIPNVQEAAVYDEVIKPILQTKCYSCHGPNKQKGKLRMDDTVMLMKGGKDGKIIEARHGDESAMIKRLLLPVDNQDHMPPKEKPQPTESQIALLHWWIDGGANFTGKVKEFQQPDKIKPVLLALQKAPEVKKGLTGIPAGPVEKADDKIIEELKDHHVVVLPVAQNSNYLMVNFVTDSVINEEDLKLLTSLKKQLIWLKMGFTNLGDEQMSSIAKLTNLTQLSVEHTSITDKGVQSLKHLENLEYLNLVGTQVTKEGILELKGLKKLHSLYLFQTRVDKTDWAALQKAFPKTQIDSGGYSVQSLPTDTMEVKEVRREQ